MKIAFLTNYWINSDGGGVREYSKNLVSSIKNENINVIVLFREGFDKKNHKLSFNKLKFVSNAFDILNREKPDAILCQGGWYTMIPAIIYKKNKNIKLIYLFHTHFDEQMSRCSLFVYNNLIKNFHSIGFVSKNLKINIENIAGLKVPQEKIFFLYAGVEIGDPTENEIEEFKKKYDITNENFYLLGLGLTALYAKKEGAKLLLKVLKDVIIKHPEVKLILTRKGIYEEELKNYTDRLGLSNNVIFTGDLINPNVATNVCDIFTHITYGEGGLSLSILEAMAFGKPIIASSIGGIPEAIENEKTGLLLNNNEIEIYNAIIKLIEHRDYARYLAENAKKKAREKFTWKNTAEKFLKLLD